MDLHWHSRGRGANQVEERLTHQSEVVRVAFNIISRSGLGWVKLEGALLWLLHQRVDERLHRRAHVIAIAHQFRGEAACCAVNSLSVGLREHGEDARCN
jgi:hypothetical protein